MEENQLIYCRNCHVPIADNAHFCFNCGQRNTDGRITVGQLFAYFIANLFNFDGRIFQTIGALAVPGKLTKNFFEGKHVRYYHPVRLFVFSGAIFIALLSWTISGEGINQVDKEWEQKTKAYYLKNAYQDLDTLSSQLELEYADHNLNIALDTLKNRFLAKNQIEDLDSVLIRDVVNINLEMSDSISPKGIKVALDDLIKLPEDSIATKYGIIDFKERLIFVQNIRIQKSLRNFIFYLIGNVLWMILVMMPLLALVLKLLYLRHDFLYVEHLVFSFHTHTFVFVLFSLVLLFFKWTDMNLFDWALLPIAIYLLFAIKKFYGQKWGKTIVKYFLANIFYVLLFVSAFFILALASIFLF